LKKLDRNLPNGEVGSPAVERRKIQWFGGIRRFSGLFGDNLGVHFGGNLTEENYYYNLKYKSMKKNYSRPAMVMETFVPNEYCDSCWKSEVQCVGQSSSQGHLIRYITFPNDPDKPGQYDMHWNGHTSHKVTYYLRLPDGITPTPQNFTTLTDYIIKVEDEQGSATTSDDIEVAHGRSSSGQDQFDGWGWLVGGNVHFTYNPTFQFLNNQPNHS